MLESGRFAVGWGEMAAGLGVTVETIDYGMTSDVDLAQVEAVLRADKGHEIKAILAVHVDTSTSVKNDIAGIREVLRS